MKIEVFRRAEEFLKLAEPSLAQAEAANNLLLGTAMLFRDPHRVSTEGMPFMAAVFEDETPILLAVLLPPYPLHLCPLCDRPLDAIRSLATALREWNGRVTGAMAQEPVVDMFVETWRELTGCSARVHVRHRLHECRQVSDIVYSAGEPRPAREDETDLLTQWLLDFQSEAGIAVRQSADQVRGRVAGDIAAGSLFVWDCDGAVSMARSARATSHGICIGGVYTPSRFRNRGYATSCVARLTQHLLDSGKEFVCLYTDLSNPTSNKIYRTIGYLPLRDTVQYVFS